MIRRLFSLIAMSVAAASAVAADIDYTTGVIFINEDWYGHQNSTVNYLLPDAPDGEYWNYRVIQTENPGVELGCTNQYGAIWDGRLYMIAKDTDVIAKGIHKFFFKLALIYSKEKRTLHRVAGVDQNHIFLFGADTVDKHLSARHSAHAVGPRVDLRVGIVGGKNRQSLSRRRGCEHHGCRGSEVFYSIVHINQITN